METTQQTGMLAKVEHPPRLLDMRGRTFGRLSVVAYAGYVSGKPGWLCDCSCGNTSRVTGTNLRSGHTLSCGCFWKEQFVGCRKTHGFRSRKVSRAYGIWDNMRARCSNPNLRHYKNYGGRGIRVCKRWDSFENFLKDMGHPPAGMQLDRRNNNLGYNPSNCRWVTVKTNCRNRRTNTYVTYRGTRLCLSAWSEELGIPAALLSDRLRRGWSVKRSFQTPHILILRNSLSKPL